jgi:Alginate export
MLTGAHSRSGFARGATRWRIAIWASILVSVPAAGQEVEALRRRVAELEHTVVTQREEFNTKLAELERRLDEPRDERSAEIADRIDHIEKRVNSLGKLLRRPVAGSSTPTADIFTALQGGLVFTGLFRTRFEARGHNIDFNGGGDGIDDDGLRFNGRFRLGFGAVLMSDPDGTGEQITALTEFQSVGSFANNSFLQIPSASNVPVPVGFSLLIEPFEVVSLYQGYVAFHRLIHKTVDIKVGRQELVFGNEMLLGNNSFQEGTSHDGLLAQWMPCDTFQLSSFYTKEAGADLSLGSSRSDFDEDEMLGLYAEYTPKRHLDFDAYALYYNARSGDQDTFITGSTAFMFDNSYRPPIFGHFFTLGARAFITDIKHCKNVLSLNAEAAWQDGSDSSPDDPLLPGTRSIGGWCGEFLANYRFNPASDGLKPIATLGYYYAQGGDDIAGGNLGFQPMFINRHFESTLRGEREDIYKPYWPGGGRYGNMDELPLFNVHILKSALSVALSDKIEVGAGYLYAITADDEGYGTGTFGQEIDVFGSYIFRDNVQFSANASVFFPGKTATSLSNLLFFDPADPAQRHADNDVAFAFYLQALIQF